MEFGLVKDRAGVMESRSCTLQAFMEDKERRKDGGTGRCLDISKAPPRPFRNQGDELTPIESRPDEEVEPTGLPAIPSHRARLSLIAYAPRGRQASLGVGLHSQGEAHQLR